MICDRKMAAKVKGEVYKIILEACCDLWFGDSGADIKTRGRVKDVKSFIGSYQKGYD